MAVSLQKTVPDPIPARNSLLENDHSGSAASAQTLLTDLPKALKNRFSIKQEFLAAGSEADLFLVCSLDDNSEFLLKLYRAGRKPKTDVLQRILNAKSERLIRTLEFAESDNRWYELQEYISQGTLAEMMSEGLVTEDICRVLLEQVSTGIEEIHSLDILHRDLKPENILIKAREPLSLVLADFGISSDIQGTQHFTGGMGTVLYTAPETLLGEVVLRKSVDYWPLGIILVEALTGVHPLKDMRQGAVSHHLLFSKNPIDVSLVPVEWRRLCKGLLLRDPSQRWGAGQIALWLQGHRDDIPLTDDEIATTLGGPAYPFKGQEYGSAAAVVGAFAQQWEQGVLQVERRYFLEWLKKQSDFEAATFVEDLLDDKKVDRDERLFLTIARFSSPKLPLIWKGTPLDESNLQTLARNNSALFVEVLARQLLTHPKLPESRRSQAVADRWRRAVRENDELWSGKDLQRLAAFRPSREIELSAAMLVSLDAKVGKELRRTVQHAVKTTSARRCGWYLALAEQVATSREGMLPALASLATVANDEGNTIIAEEIRNAEIAKNTSLWASRRAKLLRNSLFFGLGTGSVMGLLRLWMLTSNRQFFGVWEAKSGISKFLIAEPVGVVIVFLLMFALTITICVCPAYLYYRKVSEHV